MTVSHTTLNCACADVLTRTAKVLNVYADLELFRSCSKLRVTCDHCKVRCAVVPVEDKEACDLADSACLNYRITESGSLDKFGSIEDKCRSFGSNKKITSVDRNVRFVHSSADIHNSAVNVVLCEGCNICRCRACDKHGSTVVVFLERKGIACAVKAVCNKVVGDCCRIVAVDDLVYSLIFVDNEVLIAR